MKTIKNLAEDIGVSKTAIRKRLTNEFREKYTRKLADGTVCILPDGEELIISSFIRNGGNRPQTKSADDSANQFAVVSSEVSTLIEMLRKELDFKNTEIERLQKIIEKEQQARLEAPERGFFARIFGTKK